MLGRKFLLAAVTLVAVATLIPFTARAAEDDVTTYRARLTGRPLDLPPGLRTVRDSQRDAEE